MTLRERLARTPPGYRFSIGRILAIYSGLMVALLLAALDQTIVATALPTVVSELGGRLEISPRAGGGTVVLVVLPLETPAPDNPE